MPDDDRRRIAAGYRSFVDEAAPSSPRYAELAAGVAEAEDVVAFLADLPQGKRQPNLLFAALQYLWGVPADLEELRRRVRENPERLRATMGARSTQTNEAARCGGLLPALGLLDGPLTLVEVGASAGLCLYPDRYSYDYDGVLVGRRSPVHLTVATKGPVPVPHRLPDVVARIGIDLNPLDPRDSDDLAWLRALVWPGPRSADRLARLEAAAAIARAEPARMLTGDLLERLSEALALAAAGSTVVVFHTAVLPYLGRDARAAFVETVRSLPVRWIAQEGVGVVPGTGRRPDDGGWGTDFVLSLDGRPLALTGPHGGRVTWLDRAG